MTNSPNPPSYALKTEAISEQEIMKWMDTHSHDWQNYITTDSDGWAYRLHENAWMEANSFQHAVTAIILKTKQETQ